MDRYSKIFNSAVEFPDWNRGWYGGGDDAKSVKDSISESDTDVADDK